MRRRLVTLGLFSVLNKVMGCSGWLYCSRTVYLYKPALYWRNERMDVIPSKGAFYYGGGINCYSIL